MTKGADIPARLPLLAIVAGGAIAFAYLVQLGVSFAGHGWITDASGRPLAQDFLSFWSAGRMALNGHAAAAYDWPAMHVFQQQLMGHAFKGYLGWAYPPLFFLIASGILWIFFLGWLGHIWAALDSALYKRKG